MSTAEHGTRVRSGRREAVRRETGALSPVSLRLAAVHLTVLWSLAVAQPLFDVLDDGPEFFVARGSERIDILLFAFGLVFVPPLSWRQSKARCASGDQRSRARCHSVLVVLLVALLASRGSAAAGTSQLARVLPGALVLGDCGGSGLRTARGARSFLTVLAPAPMIFLVLFLTGPVGNLVWQDTSAAAAVPAGRR